MYFTLGKIKSDLSKLLHLARYLLFQRLSVFPVFIFNKIWYFKYFAIYREGRCQAVTTHDYRCTKGLDIRLISSWYSWYSAIGFGRNMAPFSDFSSFSLSHHHPQISGLYLGISSWYFLISSWNLSVCFIEIWSIFSWYPLLHLWYSADILISVEQISSKLLLLGRCTVPKPLNVCFKRTFTPRSMAVERSGEY